MSPAPQPPAVSLAIIVLSHNSAAIIGRTLRAAQALSGQVFVVDSGSGDGTQQIVTDLGCSLLHRPFVNYADQRNWAIDEIGAPFAWQLHLDADEVLDAQAVADIRRVLALPSASNGWILKRRTYFLGRALRFGGTSNFHLRLFRSGSARCEDRLYDQHFVSAQPAARLGGLLHDMNLGGLAEWTARHNRWSDMEAAELLRPPAAAAGQIDARLSADPRERRRFYKRGYYRAPPLWRALALFGYRYLLQAGFMDGRAGFLYAFFQVLWFRMLVDAKLQERLDAAATP